MIETSYISISFPTVVLPVNSYIGEMMITEVPELMQTYSLDVFEMKVQGINRTLVELDDEFKNLVAEVREVRKTSPKCPSAENDVNIPEILRTIVEKEIYKADYQEITEKILEERVSYEVAIEALKEIAGGW